MCIFQYQPAGRSHSTSSRVITTIFLAVTIYQVLTLCYLTHKIKSLDLWRSMKESTDIYRPFSKCCMLYSTQHDMCSQPCKAEATFLVFQVRNWGLECLAELPKVTQEISTLESNLRLSPHGVLSSWFYRRGSQPSEVQQSDIAEDWMGPKPSH